MGALCAGPSNGGPVSFLDLQVHHAPLLEEIGRALNGVVESGRFIMGPRLEELELALAGYCRSRFAFGVSSGSDALMTALMALEIDRGAEVITTPYTFFATAGTIARIGATPVFSDIDPDTYNLDAALVRRGATLGANCTIVCGNTIGEYATVAAGAVVTKHVPAHRLVAGVPARPLGWVCRCGEVLRFGEGERVGAETSCGRCGERYVVHNDGNMRPLRGL